MQLNQGQFDSIARALGDTEGGLSGSQIEHLSPYVEWLDTILAVRSSSTQGQGRPNRDQLAGQRQERADGKATIFLLQR